MTENSGIPIFGLDFLGIIDRGTNIIEIKPITLCNINCRYCFVNAGKHPRNFMLDLDYIMAGISQLAEFKGSHDLEVHIAPYGESLVYPPIYELIARAKEVPGVEVVSMQSNGLLLSPERIAALESAGLTRINVSLNTFDEKLARYLSCSPRLNMEHLLQMLEAILDSSVDLLLAPVWFPKKNEEAIPEIIQYVKNKRAEGYTETDIQLGIQKYLDYKHGRKLSNVRERTFKYFYSQLRDLETEYDIKLVLYPEDFGIHYRPTLRPPVKKGDDVPVEVVCEGRSRREWIGKISDEFAVKIQARTPLAPGQQFHLRLSKAKPKENLLTGKSGYY